MIKETMHSLKLAVHIEKRQRRRRSTKRPGESIAWQSKHFKFKSTNWKLHLELHLDWFLKMASTFQSWRGRPDKVFLDYSKWEQGYVECRYQLTVHQNHQYH